MRSLKATSRARTDLALRLDPAPKSLEPRPAQSLRLKPLLKHAAVPGTKIKLDYEVTILTLPEIYCRANFTTPILVQRGKNNWSKVHRH